MTCETKSRLQHEALLDRYAEVAVKIGLRPQPGQQIVLTAPMQARPFVLRFAKHAYRAGASLVQPIYDDEELTLCRFREASDESFDQAPSWLWNGVAQAFRDTGAARMAIKGGNPALLSQEDPARVSRANMASGKATKPAMDEVTKFAINWSLLTYPTVEWAKMVFPNDTDEVALHKLWTAIFDACRITVEDPIANWTAHNIALHARTRMLNEKRFAALHFKGPHTDLRVGLADGHLWAGGQERSLNGVFCNPNIPTEEVFTTPHRLRVDGWATSSRPLSYNGTLIEGIRVRFENGRIVQAHAEKGEPVLQKMLSADEGASRIGEVAVVPHSSPISRLGITFFNTLYDENAASHIAQGQCYTSCLVDGDKMTAEQIAAAGGNASVIHVDWMIGGAEMDIDGITATGEAQPLMRKGEWV